jgi:hypothetical protein
MVDVLQNKRWKLVGKQLTTKQSPSDRAWRISKATKQMCCATARAVEMPGLRQHESLQHAAQAAWPKVLVMPVLSGSVVVNATF